MLEPALYTQGRERMTRHRATIITLTLLALSAASPAAAMAGSLLSGYGGPGAGSQAIIGSTLIKTPPNAGSGGGASTLAGAPSSSSGASQGASTTRSATRTSARSGARSHGQSAPGKLPSAFGKVSRSQTAYGLSSSQASVEGSPALGVSGVDLLYIALALGALLLTGALTAKLARPPR